MKNSIIGNIFFYILNYVIYNRQKKAVRTLAVNGEKFKKRI